MLFSSTIHFPELGGGNGVVGTGVVGTGVVVGVGIEVVVGLVVVDEVVVVDLVVVVVVVGMITSDICIESFVIRSSLFKGIDSTFDCRIGWVAAAL